MYKIINCKIIGKTFDNSLALLICTDLKNYTHTCAHRKDKHRKTIGQKSEQVNQICQINVWEYNVINDERSKSKIMYFLIFPIVKDYLKL